MELPVSVLQAYGLETHATTIKPFGTGLINHTWSVVSGGNKYILQRINKAVFKDPTAIASNIELIGLYLHIHSPEYYFVSPVATLDGKQMVCDENEEAYYRLLPFVPDSHSKDVAETAASAYEAAVQFGRFTRLLSGFDANKLQITIPHFHDLSLRYRQFVQSLESGNRQRIEAAAELVSFLQEQSGIVTEFESIQHNPVFKKRVTHHDTKISNVLFDPSDKAICVIDLDTVMPGYFISDIGDMMRTYLPTVSEEEADFSKIEVRDDVYHAICNGYLQEMEQELSAAEKKSFFYAARFMIYMQAIRFLADHFNDDVYYGADYPDHNLVRAANQAVLLQKLLSKEATLSGAA
ncbi:MAG: aminoglycoside phosphotransferase family protein [Bacteroidota bacterium]